MSVTSNKKVVEQFIQQIWNNRELENLDRFIHNEYYDHSFVQGVAPNTEGLKFWIQASSTSFHHQTVIESIMAEDDMVTVRISFKIKHTGKWRNIEASGKEVRVKGFRQFRLKDSRIAEHWALLDGESLQASLLEVQPGCELVRK